MKLRDRKIKVPEGYSTHHVCCPHDCPDTCSMIVTRDDSTGKAVRIQGDPTHPVTKGYLCNKVNHYLDLVYNKNRILYPHKRIGPKGPGARFERISWDEALTTVTDNFNEVISKYGSESVLPYSYSGTLGMLGFWSMDQRFWNKMEASRLVQSICIYAAFFANLHTYGVSNGPSLQDASEDADLIILWGANLVSTGVHAILLPQSGVAPITADTVKTSAGAVFQVPLGRCPHIKDAVFYLQAHGVQIVAASEKAQKTLYETPLTHSTALVMGSEERGVSPAVLKIADHSARLPISGSIASLNVSVACGAFLYEVVRQRLGNS